MHKRYSDELGLLVLYRYIGQLLPNLFMADCLDYFCCHLQSVKITSHLRQSTDLQTTTSRGHYVMILCGEAGTGSRGLLGIGCRPHVSRYDTVGPMLQDGLADLILQCMKGRLDVMYVFTGEAAVLGGIQF